MENTETNALVESAISQENASAEESVQTEVEGAPQPETNTENTENSENASHEENSNESEFILPVNFNHENRNLSREEAIEFAQIGMKFKDSGINLNVIKPVWNTLDYIAAQKECSIKDLVEGMLSSEEEKYREDLKDKFGEDEGVIDDLMKVYRDRQKEKYEQVLTQRKNDADKVKSTLESRLADEFIELKGEFSEITEFSALPKSVKEEAANGRDLLSSYLRYLHSESKRVNAAQQSQKVAEAASTGSGNSAERDNQTSAEKAFLKGVFG